MAAGDSDVRALKPQLDRIEKDVGEINQQLKSLNGCVRANQMDIAILKATSLRLDAVKIGAIIGGVLMVMAALLKVAGVL